MDIRGQLISVRLRWPVVVGAAVLVALVVFALRSTAAPLYSATLNARVDAPVASASQPSEAVSFAAGTVAGLAQTPSVLSDAVERSGRPLDLETARSRITVAPGRTEGFLTITAMAPTATEAELLAGAMSFALSVRLGEDAKTLAAAATTPLRSELDQLNRQRASTTDPGARAGLQERFDGVNAALIEVQSRPGSGLLTEKQAAVSPDPVSPMPVRDALLAFLVAAIVVAEGLIVWRAVRGRIPEGDPEAALAPRCHRPVRVLERRPAVAPTLALLHRDRLVAAPGVTVVHLTGRRRVFDVGAALVDTHRALRLAGAPLVVADPVQDDGAGRVPTAGRPVVSIVGPSVDAEVLRRLRLSGLPVLLVVDTAHGRVDDVTSAVGMVRASDVDVVAVLVWRGWMPRSSGTGNVVALPRHRTPTESETETGRIRAIPRG